MSATPHEQVATTVLSLSAIGKCYREYRHELARIASWFGFHSEPSKEHWVLSDIDFSLSAGETVGIVGQNGAGKSTLLKIIAGTLKPSCGSLQVDGRISAILELGMGFHHDLTGRQNVYHAAGLMGYNHEQIEGVIDQVEAFAEIGAYFDQPVRTYSSGMQMRVAFSVATMYRPEILIVDEALSVGDTYFQHKSFNLIRQYSTQGSTLLIVSHDRTAIQSICNRVILLDKGLILKDDEPEIVMDYYNALIADKENAGIKQKKLANGKVVTSSGTRDAIVANLALCTAEGQVLEMVAVGQEVMLRLEIDAFKDIKELVAGFLIKDRLGQDVFGTNSFFQHQSLGSVTQGARITCEYSFPVNLGPGSYSISVALHSGSSHLANNYHWLDKALIFTVANLNKKQFSGIAWLPTRLAVENHNSGRTST